jgi:hypothetical protein
METQVGVFLMLFGCILIVGGIFGENFYAADVDSLAPFNQKSSRWSGKVLFVVVGVLLLAIGAKLTFWPH